MSEIEMIGVDLDGTLAKWYGRAIIDYIPDKIGDPIPEMVARVKKWLAQGKEVVIFTARVHPSNADAEIARLATQRWCLDNFGVILEVTCMKHPRMTWIFDDRAVSVEKDTGRILKIDYVEEEEEDEADALGSQL
jgi:hydroxymethylpyrimidine pyrophosphatase-like HAD family hydrolase